MKGKMDILEKRRLDLDASRRDHEKLEAKVEKKGAPEGEPPATSDIKLQAKHSSVEGACYLKQPVHRNNLLTRAVLQNPVFNFGI